MDHGSTASALPQREHQTLWSKNIWKHEAWPVLGRFARPWHKESHIHDLPRSEVRFPSNLKQCNIAFTLCHCEVFDSLVFRALMNVMKNYSHLMEVDTLLVRSCLFLMPVDELMECIRNMNPQLLDLLHVFTNKVPQDIAASSSQVNGNSQAFLHRKMCSKC